MTSMKTLFIICFAVGVGMFFLQVGTGIVQNHISDNDMNQALIWMALFWSLDGIIVGLDYFFVKKKSDDKQTQVYTKESET